MAIRGPKDFLDDQGVAQHREQTINSTNTWRFHLQKRVDGTVSNYDVSAVALIVKFRARLINTTQYLINDTMTKVSGSGGLVSADIKFSSDDWGAEDEAEVSCWIVNTAVADGDTPSGFQESQVGTYGTTILHAGWTA